MTSSILTLLNFQNAIVDTALTCLESLLIFFIQKMPITMVHLISDISFIDKMAASDLVAILDY